MNHTNFLHQPSKTLSVSLQSSALPLYTHWHPLAPFAPTYGTTKQEETVFALHFFIRCLFCFSVLFYITYPLYFLCLACYFSPSPTASLLFWTFCGTVLTRLYGSMVVYHKKWVRGNIYRACLLRRLALYPTDFPIAFSYISHSSLQARTHVYENLNFRVRTLLENTSWNIASRAFGNNDVDIYIIYDVCSRNIMKRKHQHMCTTRGGLFFSNFTLYPYDIYRWRSISARMGSSDETARWQCTSNQPHNSTLPA